MRGDEPEPWDGGDPVRRSDAVDGTNEFREIGLRAEIQAPTGPALCPDMTEPWIRREIVAIRIHVLPEERDFLEARRGDRTRLGDDLVERPAPLWATAEGHDAVGAGLVAAIDDRQPGADTEVVVRTEIMGRGEPVQLDYRLEKVGTAWKIYDLNVLGVWLVETYRTQFSQEINAKGIDGLIASLSERNKSNNAKKS